MGKDTHDCGLCLWFFPVLFISSHLSWASHSIEVMLSSFPFSRRVSEGTRSLPRLHSCSDKPGFPRGTGDKGPACKCRRRERRRFDPRVGKTPGGGHSSPLQYPCLEHPMHRGAWQATVHRVTESQTRLKRLGSMRDRAAGGLGASESSVRSY